MVQDIGCHVLVSRPRSLWDASECVPQVQSLHHGMSIRVGLVAHEDLTRQTPNEMVSLIDELCTPGHVAFSVIRTWDPSPRKKTLLAIPRSREGTGTLARMTLSPSLRKPPASFGLRDWTPASEPIVRWLFSILEKALQGQIPLTFRCVTLSLCQTS